MHAEDACSEAVTGFARRRPGPAATVPVPYGEVRRWLFETCLPFWARNGVDRERGGFVEHFALDGGDARVPFKRTRVTARQIYVFSHAAVLGVPGSAEIAGQGVSFLTRNAWLGEDRGWARRLAADGCVLDRTPDLYDLAFVLFALGWYTRATGSAEARDGALGTLAYIDRHMRHASGGFLAEKPATGPRLQNPQMHLLEAALANLEATGDIRFRHLADELFELFGRRLFQPATGTLPEYYDEDLRPLAGEQGRLVEPGHHFEWAWILAWYQRLTGTDVRPWAGPLSAFAERHGVDHESGAVHAAVRDDGTVLDRSQRVWPMTERLQAAVAMYDLAGHDPSPAFASTASRLLSRHLDHRPAGTWADIHSETGAIMVDKIPASTLYHVMIGFTEMLRVGGCLGHGPSRASCPERTG